MSNELQEIIKCRNSFTYFCKNYVKVLHPERGLVNFELHGFQKDKVFPAFEEKRFVILKKFRQAGLSTLASIYSLWKILFFIDQRVLMISITDRDSKNLMSYIQRAWENLPDWMRCPTSEYSHHVIKLETGSEIRCGTPKMGRGYSANLIVVDEAAFISGMDEVWKSIYPTLSSAGEEGKAFIISTVNGLGNWYADTYHDALDEKNDFYCVDLSYKEHPEYNNEDYVERMKTQLGPRGFDQEVLGIFLSGFDTFIKPESIRVLTEQIEKDTQEPKKLYHDKLWIWKEPKGERPYILCADVAEGLGGDHDFSAFHIIDSVTLEQVCEFCDNNVSTYEFAKIVDEIATYYNQAITVIENNSLGVAVLNRLYYDLEYENIYWSRQSKRNMKIGFTMSTPVRPLVLNYFSNLIENNHTRIHSSRLLHEIQTFEFNARTGKAEARRGRHDDLIISFAIGLFIRDTVMGKIDDSDREAFILEDSEEIANTFDKQHNKIIMHRSDEEDKNLSDPIIIQRNLDYEDDEQLLKEFGWSTTP